MRQCQTPLPDIWLVSDARNDAVLEKAILRLPRGGVLVFRHHHLALVERRQRFRALARIARCRGIAVALAADVQTARAWGADAAYGSARTLTYGRAFPRLVTVHSLKELRKVGRADAVMLSPVFPTRSHPGAKVLGPLRFRLIAAHSPVPVIALGGMNARKAARIGATCWAAIDGLSTVYRRDS